MPMKKDVLRKKTHKDQEIDTEQRIFYTLSDNAEVASFRTMKLIGLLVSHLRVKNLLTEAELDDMLLQIGK